MSPGWLTSTKVELKSTVKLGAGLFKEGFTYNDTLFYKLPEEGGCYELAFPAFILSSVEVWLDVHYYNFNDDGKKVEYRRKLPAKQVLDFGVPEFLEYMRDNAKLE